MLQDYLLSALHLFMICVSIYALCFFHYKPRNTGNAKISFIILALSLTLSALFCLGDFFQTIGLLFTWLFVCLPIFIGGIGVFSLFNSNCKNVAISVFYILFAIVTTSFGYYISFIEPYNLKISHIKINSNNIKGNITVVVLADIQTNNVTNYERRVFNEVKNLKPDLLLFAGDYIQTDLNKKSKVLMEQLSLLIKEASYSPKLGAYAIEGNVDLRFNWEEIFKNTNIKTIKDTTHLSIGEVELTLLSLHDSFNENLEIEPTTSKFNIIMGHSPNFALGKNSANVLLAGHTHGGQIHIPSIGPLLTLSKLPRKWASGQTHISSEKTLIVSNGIGYEHNGAPRIRFLCPPEIIVLELNPALMSFEQLSAQSLAIKN